MPPTFPSPSPPLSQQPRRENHECVQYPRSLRTTHAPSSPKFLLRAAGTRSTFFPILDFIWVTNVAKKSSARCQGQRRISNILGGHTSRLPARLPGALPASHPAATSFFPWGQSLSTLPSQVYLSKPHRTSQKGKMGERV